MIAQAAASVEAKASLKFLGSGGGGYCMPAKVEMMVLTSLAWGCGVTDWTLSCDSLRLGDGGASYIWIFSISFFLTMISNDRTNLVEPSLCMTTLCAGNSALR